MDKRYTIEEDLVLEKYWFTEGSVGCHKRLPNRTVLSLQARAYKLNIKGNKQFGGWVCSKDISGKLFGDWLEIEYSFEESSIRNGTYYRCVCKCGRTVFVRRDKLARDNPQKSCGHCNDIAIGKMYGYLEPVCRVGNYKAPSGRQYAQYMCICHYRAQGCQRYHVVRGCHLKDGGNESCGCFRDEKARKMMLGETGTNSRSWKEDEFCVTPLQKRVYNSIKYKQWRKLVYKRDNYTCQYSGQQGGVLCVHHLKAFAIIWREYKIITYEQAMNCKELWAISNGVTLSKERHKLFHSIYGNNCTSEDFNSWMKGSPE